MKRQLFIQKLLASVLLLVFTISITPKAYFHDIIARHKDGPVCTHPPQASACIHKQTFHCHFDDLVVTAPFLFENSYSSLVLPVEQAGKNSFYNSTCTIFTLLHKKGRAPPVA